MGWPKGKTRILSKEHRAKIAKANTGKKRSAEARLNISLGKKGKPGRKLSKLEIENLRRINTGKCPSAETRRKMSEAKLKNPTNYWLGKKRGPYPKSWRDAISRGNKGKVRSPEMRARISRGLMGHEAHHGKIVLYRGIKFRSEYEVRVAKALTRLKVRWQYEPTRFKFEKFTYKPDFYLPDDDTYWEVKGWYGPDSRKKVEAFRSEYPEIPLVLVMLPTIEQLEQSATRSR